MPKGCKCCCPPPNPRADYVYAAVEGNICVNNTETRFVGPPVKNGNAYNCVRGQLPGLDPISGVFTAPKTAIYHTNVWANYFKIGSVCPTGTVGDPFPFKCSDCPECTGVTGPGGLCCIGPSGCTGAIILSAPKGTTNTQIRRELRENICGGPGSGFGGLDIAVVGQSSPWTFICEPGTTGTTGCNFVSNASLGGDIPLRKGERIQVSVFQENDQGYDDVSLFLELMIVRGPNINLGKPRGPGVGT